MRHWIRTCAASTARSALRIASAIGVRAALLLAGFGLLGYGCYLLHPAAGFAVPGAVLVWNWLPTRGPFVIRPPQPGRRVKELR